jgi:hypothetical protein
MATSQLQTDTRTGAQAAQTPGPVDAQRDEHGGLSWGSAFFGWLVAIGMAALLISLLAALGAATGLTKTSPSSAAKDAGTVGIVGGILLLLVLTAAYYCGGYVAGRMARFNGPRQGVAVWVLGLLITVALGVAGAVLGSKYNLLQTLNLPRIPVGQGSLTTGGLVALAAIVVGTLLAAMAGGKAGTRFHRRVDRTGYQNRNETNHGRNPA